MSHRYTAVEIIPVRQQLQTTSAVWSCGSCFSDSIGKKLAETAFDVLANPYGVMYNPLSIARTIQTSINPIIINEEDCGVRGQVHFSYHCHSELSALSKEQLLSNITKATKYAQLQLAKASHVLLTLGTSIVHELVSSGGVVANCHKMSPSLFNKRMLTIPESYEAIAEQLSMLQDKHIIITVSPIRHLKEGLVQNQRSKARLIEVAHLLAERFENVSYFPAYELVLDELRDYRYFAEDLIHPSDVAIDLVWDRFQYCYLSDHARQKVKDVSELNRSIHHRSQFPDSEEHLKFLDVLERQKEKLRLKYPEAKI